MAQMFPDIDRLGRITSINKSEIEFYNLLKNSEYTSGWKVFYSRIIKSRYRTREIDFIVFIPDEGIVLVELKANNPVRISQDEFIYNYNGVEKTQENPFRKIKNITHQFKTTLNLSEEEKNKIFVSSLIVFPNLNFEFEDGICDDALNYLNSRVKYRDIPFFILANFKKKKEREDKNRIGANAPKEEINRIMDKIYSRFIKTEEIKVESGNERLEELEENAKRHMLNFHLSFSGFRRLFVDAPSSGGKSFLALQQIINKRADPNFKVIYICRSKFQFENMKYSFQKTNNVDIARYGFLSDIPKRRYDMAIMDDFDLDGDALAKADEILEGGVKKGNIWILSDSENKKSCLKSFLFENNFEDCYARISLNFRNNIAISDFVNKISGKEIYHDNLFEYYSDIKFVHYSNSNFETRLEGIISELVNVDRFSAEDIKIITPKNINESLLSSLLSRKKWSRELKPYSREWSGGICYSSIEDFMGLDSRVIILLDIDNTLKSPQKELYKGATRARHRLVIMFKENAEIMGDCI